KSRDRRVGTEDDLVEIGGKDAVEGKTCAEAERGRSLKQRAAIAPHATGLRPSLIHGIFPVRAGRLPPRLHRPASLPICRLAPDSRSGRPFLPLPKAIIREGRLIYKFEER